MKTLFGVIAIASLLSTSTKAQSSAPTRIHFMNLTMGINIPEVKTTIESTKPILLKRSTWVTVETVGDSLGLVIDGKPYFIHFVPNKQYYFVLQSSNGSRPIITEKSEQEFALTATIDNVKRLEAYSLGKDPN
ncbi:hypothetical protein [Spirosoma fluminis]